MPPSMCSLLPANKNQFFSFLYRWSVWVFYGRILSINDDIEWIEWCSYNTCVAGLIAPMNSLIAAVNLNSQDVEEGQLPDDGYHTEPVKSIDGQAQSHNTSAAWHSFKPPLESSYPRTHNHDQSEELSADIVLEVVDDQFCRDRLDDRKNKKITKMDMKSKTHHVSVAREKDKYQERPQKQKKVQRNDKRPHVGQNYEREEMKTAPPNPNYPPQQYYPQYMYPTQPQQMQMGQYPPYHPYPYPMPYMQQGQQSFNGMLPMSQYPHHNNPNVLQAGPSSYKQPYMQHPSAQYPEHPGERPQHKGQQLYRPPPLFSQQQQYPTQFTPYNPYDHYDRHRENQQREEKQKAQRKREFIEELRVQLKKNMKEFNREESLDLLEAVKCVLKFQPQPQHQHSHTKDRQPAITQRSYERSLLRIHEWLNNGNPSIREFTKGLLSAIQMEDIISKTRESNQLEKEQEGRTGPGGTAVQDDYLKG